MNKQRVCISTETTIDIRQDLLEEFDIRVVPFNILFGEETVEDGLDITPDKIFEFVDKTGVLPRTSAVNEFAYEEHFGELLKEFDAVVHICLSSKISSAYENACRVASRMENVYVIDSLSLSTGIAVLALKACQKRDEGMEAKQIYEDVLNLVPKVSTSFIVSTLEYLHKGGRCSGGAKMAQQILRFKPCIIMENGVMDVKTTFLGKGSIATHQYAEMLFKNHPNIDLSMAFITHASATPDMVDQALKDLKERGFKRIEVTFTGATITSHCGPKTLGIIFMDE